MAIQNNCINNIKGHGSVIIITSILYWKAWNIAVIIRMWKQRNEVANPLGKMMLIDFCLTQGCQAFNLKNKTKNCLSMKCNKSKYTKIRCACIFVLFCFLNLLPFTCRTYLSIALWEREAEIIFKLYL